MNIPLNNANAVEPSTELANALIKPILNAVEVEQDDEAAKALIALIRVMAKEKSPDVRELFAFDLITAIYAKTAACRAAATTFADSAQYQFATA